MWARRRQRDYQLEHRTDVDLKDKWRNITKAIGQNKKMRGFNMAADLVLRVQNCMRVAAVRSRTQKPLQDVCETLHAIG
jgi:hypothetical protein